MRKISKYVVSTLVVCLLVAIPGISAFAQDTNKNQEYFEEYTTTILPVDAMIELNISLDSVELPLNSQYFDSRYYVIHSDGITVVDTFITPGLTKADSSKTVTSYGQFIASGSSVPSIKWEVKGTFYYNSTDNTAYCRNESGKITQNTSSFTISDQSTTTSQGGGGLTKKWAMAKFSFKRTNNLGNKISHNASAKVDSTGKETVSYS